MAAKVPNLSFTDIIFLTIYEKSSYFVACENHITAQNAVTDEKYFNILSFGYAGMSRRPHYRVIAKEISIAIFSRVLRDSTPRFVRPSVGWSVGRSVGRLVPILLFFAVFGHTALAQML